MTNSGDRGCTSSSCCPLNSNQRGQMFTFPRCNHVIARLPPRRSSTPESAASRTRRSSRSRSPTGRSRGGDASSNSGSSSKPRSDAARHPKPPRNFEPHPRNDELVILLLGVSQRCVRPSVSIRAFVSVFYSDHGMPWLTEMGSLSHSNLFRASRPQKLRRVHCSRGGSYRHCHAHPAS